MTNPMISANEALGKNAVSAPLSKRAILRLALWAGAALVAASVVSVLWPDGQPERSVPVQAGDASGGLSVAATLAGEFSVLDSTGR